VLFRPQRARQAVKYVEGEDEEEFSDKLSGDEAYSSPTDDDSEAEEEEEDDFMQESEQSDYHETPKKRKKPAVKKEAVKKEAVKKEAVKKEEVKKEKKEVVKKEAKESKKESAPLAPIFLKVSFPLSYFVFDIRSNDVKMTVVSLRRGLDTRTIQRRNTKQLTEEKYPAIYPALLTHAELCLCEWIIITIFLCRRQSPLPNPRLFANYF